MWMLYLGPPGSPTGTLYEVIGEVELVHASQADVGLSQSGGTSKPTKSERIPDRKKSSIPKQTRSSQVCRKNTGSVRSGRGQSPTPGRTSERSRTPERARTPIRRTPVRVATTVRGKAPMSQTSPAPASDCIILEPYAPHPHEQHQPGIPEPCLFCVAGSRIGISEANPPRSRAFGRRRRFPDLRISEHRIWKGQATLGKKSPLPRT